MHFVPAHPVAGTEHSGPDAGFAELFVGRWCILTPPEGTDPAAVEKLAAFWRALGANVETMPAAHHDLVLAITSHLPHLIAYTIVGTADELAEVTRSEVLKFSAGGFRDFTRIAASDPTMWRDVFLANKDAVLEMLGTFNEDLAQLTRAIRRGDGEALVRSFHPNPRHPPRHRRRSGRIRRRRISAAPHPDLPVEPLPRPYAVSDERLSRGSARLDRQRFVTAPRSAASVNGFVITSWMMRVEAVRALALIGIAGHQQNSQIGIVARRGERQRDAVHDRHADVGQQKIETAVFALEQIERVAAVTCGFDVVAGGRQARARTWRITLLRLRRSGCEPWSACSGHMSLRLRKRTSTSWASGGGEASRVWNATPRPAAAWRAAARRSTNRFPAARRCGPQSADAARSAVLPVIVDDIAADHQDRHALMLLGGGGEAVEIEPAQIHRQADPGIERGGLRHGAHEIVAPTDDDRIGDNQRHDARLQARQRPLQAPALARRGIAARGNGLDIFERFGAWRDGSSPPRCR